ncbi:MAG: hypothetical protein RJQ07_08700 [Pseudomonadales bacterium]
MKDIPLKFLAAISPRTWQMPLALFAILASLATTMFFYSDDKMLLQFLTPHLLGTLTMLATLPPFLLGSLFYLHRCTLDLITELQPDSDDATATALRHRANNLLPAALTVVVLSACFGLYQNNQALSAILDGADFAALDLTIIAGNCILWSMIGLLMGWRVPVSLALSRFGRYLKINLYKAESGHPLANLAAKDVLIVAGAMSFMSLQSLDAEFRWVNYEAGVYVGVPSAIALLILPLLGLHQNIKAHKVQRLTEIDAHVQATDHNNIADLELLKAHAERIKHLSNWPFNAPLVTKILGYAIIAPLAWVGAALVEILIDRMAG